MTLNKFAVDLVCHAAVNQLSAMHKEGRKLDLEFEKHQDFLKARLPEPIRARLLEVLAFPRDADALLEIYRIFDLRGDISSHGSADKMVFVLGEDQGFEPPLRAQIFLEQTWRPIQMAGWHYNIPQGMPHGFRIEKGGSLAVLFVLSPLS